LRHRALESGFDKSSLQEYHFELREGNDTERRGMLPASNLEPWINPRWRDSQR
jgi:hypothetical protein